MLSRHKEIILEILRTAGPVIIAVTILQFTLIKMPAIEFLRFLFGAFLVVGGFFLFMRGIKIGLIPIGEMIGAETPKKGSAILVLVIAFVMGFSVTVAEPDVRVLSQQVDIVSGGTITRYMLVPVIAAGVGLFVLLAMFRIIKGVPIAYLLFGGYLVVFIISFFTPASFLPVSFDAGGVTTGPVTVPFIISLGLGTASVLGGNSSIADGFGLIGLASIGPVISVMLLGVVYG
ncbi:MAG: DUF1538 domain-containing protein [Actinomycetota bacterium]